MRPLAMVFCFYLAIAAICTMAVPILLGFALDWPSFAAGLLYCVAAEVLREALR